MANLLEILDGVSHEVPGCLLTSVVSLETGLPLAAVSEIDSEDAAGADAFHSQLYQQIQLAVRELGGEQGVRSVVISSDDATFISWPIGDGYFWHVVTSPDTTLGFTRAMMRKVHDDVIAGVEELLES